MPHMWCRGKALHEDRLSRQIDMIDINLIQSWNEEQIVELYRAGGWWKDYMDSTQVNDLIRGSYLFAVAVDVSTGRAVGMGRVISDGVSDGYIQDLVVLEEWQNHGSRQDDRRKAYRGVQSQEDRLGGPDRRAGKGGLL